jgi:hypothetical protein
MPICECATERVQYVLYDARVISGEKGPAEARMVAKNVSVAGLKSHVYSENEVLETYASNPIPT